MRLKDGSTAKTGEPVRVVLGERNALHGQFDGKHGSIKTTSDPLNSAAVEIDGTSHLFHGSVLEAAVK